MSWEEIDDILFDGDDDAIKMIRCPECGGDMTIDEADGSLRIQCVKCGSRASYKTK